MKEIKAYSRSNRVDDVVDALEALPGLAVVTVGGFGHTHDGDAMARVQMTKLEIDAPDALVETIIGCIVRHARTGAGHAGEGNVFFSSCSRRYESLMGVEAKRL